MHLPLSYLVGLQSASCQEAARATQPLGCPQQSLVKSPLPASFKEIRCIMVAANISCQQKLQLREVKQRVEWHRVTKPFLG